MNLKSKHDRLLAEFHEIGFQLGRIADTLEGLVNATNPLNVWDGVEDDSTIRTFFTNEDDEIVASHLKKFGREFKPSTPKK